MGEKRVWPVTREPRGGFLRGEAGRKAHAERPQHRLRREGRGGELRRAPVGFLASRLLPWEGGSRREERIMREGGVAGHALPLPLSIHLIFAALRGTGAGLRSACPMMMGATGT